MVQPARQYSLFTTLTQTIVTFLPLFKVTGSNNMFVRLFSLTLVSRLPTLSERISIWILRCLALGDSFGGGESSKSSLDDDSSEVSGMHDFFAFFVNLFLGSDESESVSVLILPLFLFACSPLFFEGLPWAFVTGF